MHRGQEGCRTCSTCSIHCPCCGPHAAAKHHPQIKRTWGLQRTNRQLQEELVTALHCRLRWTSRPEDKGSLAALLLREGELAQLQLLLCGLPGLRSDDEALQDIRDIFKVCVCRGSRGTLGTRGPHDGPRAHGKVRLGATAHSAPSQAVCS